VAFTNQEEAVAQVTFPIRVPAGDEGRSAGVPAFGRMAFNAGPLREGASKYIRPYRLG